MSKQDKIAEYRQLRDENLRTIDKYLLRIAEVEKLVENAPCREEQYRQRRRLKILYSALNDIRYAVAQIENLLYAWGDDEIVRKKRENAITIIRYHGTGKQSRRNRIPAGAFSTTICEQETRRVRKNGFFGLLAGGR